METLLVFDYDELNYFWKIKVHENKYSVTFGKKGTSGVVKIKEFDTADNCRIAASLQIREKLKKGYKPSEFSCQIKKENPMSEDVFWSLIDGAKKEGESFDSQMAFLLEQLAKKPIKEIVCFDAIFQQFFMQLYTPDIWAVANLILGRCTENCFDSFRAWLLYLGKETYESSLIDPEEMIPHLEKLNGNLPQHEQLIDLACSAYEEKTGLDDGSYFDLYEHLAGPIYSDPEINLNWSEELEQRLKEKCPRLWRIYGNNPL